MDDAPYFLGIDGGATKTDAVLIDRAGRARGQGRSGPSNYYHISISGAVTNVVRAARQALRTARVHPPIDGMVAALSGMNTAHDHRILSRALAPRLQSLVGRRLAIVNDVFAAYASGVTRPYGAAIIAGTGSNAIAHGRTGAIAQAGGYGSLLSDEGSAYAIARAALRAVVRSVDGRGPATLLTQHLFRATGSTTIQEFAAYLNRPSTRKDDIAAIAPIVERVAQRGDRVARRILEKTACDLALMATTVLRETALLRTSCELVLVGGVFRNRAILRRFEQLVRQRAPQSVFVHPRTSIAVGAARLAHGQWGHD